VKRLKCLLVCLALTLAGRYALGQSATGDAAGQRWWSHIQFLADDNLEGRDVGSRGYEKASDYMGFGDGFGERQLVYAGAKRRISPTRSFPCVYSLRECIP
jgi:hypothetical protein